MPESARTKDKRLRDNQRAENKALRAIMEILKDLFEEVNVYSTCYRTTCPLCGCLLFESDDTCPGCRAALLLEELHRGQEVHLQALQDSGRG